MVLPTIVLLLNYVDNCLKKYICPWLYSLPKMEKYSKPHTLPKVILFLGCKRNVIPSQTYKAEAQKKPSRPLRPSMS